MAGLEAKESDSVPLMLSAGPEDLTVGGAQGRGMPKSRPAPKGWRTTRICGPAGEEKNGG